jgi:tRNA (cmo5U34)-methyltransferase
MQDKVFNKAIVKQFEFDEQVASVFDDMLMRSVPFYDVVIKLSVDLLKENIKKKDKVLDLGCSTASFLLALEQKCKEVEYIGIDNASAMLDQARKKLLAYDSKITLINKDILEYPFPKVKVISAFYTLQFIRPLEREKLINKIYNALNDDGIFLFSEKLITKNKVLNKQLIDIYYDYKKEQGYTKFEIMQKREALENVLIPYTQDENEAMLKEAGFKYSELLFRWANFALFIAYK